MNPLESYLYTIGFFLVLIAAIIVIVKFLPVLIIVYLFFFVRDGQVKVGRVDE